MRSLPFAVIVAVIVAVARVSSAQTAPCDTAITPEQAKAVFGSLQKLGANTDCKLAGFRTERWRAVAKWTPREGAPAELVLVPVSCAPGGSIAIGALALEGAEAFQKACPAAYAGLARALAASESPAGTLDYHDGTWHARGMRRSGFALLGGAALALFACLAWLVVRWRSWRLTRPWWGVVLGGLGLALVVRLSVSPALSNWYAEVAAPVGGGWPRFGPIAFSFQLVCAAVLPWSDRALFAVNAVLGALAIPLVALVMRACGMNARAAAGTVVLLALSPLHVRVSASPSEHVLAAFFTLLALAMWTFAARDRRWWLGALALLVVPAAAFTRADALPQLMAVPIWGLVARWQARAKAGPPRRADWIAAGLHYAVIAAVGLASWRLVIVPARHPHPAAQAVLRAALDLLSQFWTAAITPPHWVAFTAIALGIVGIAAMVRSQRALLAVVVASLALGFVPLGRTLDTDGLVGARYFQVAIPIALLLSGAGFGWASVMVERAARAASERWSATWLPPVATGGTLLGLAAVAWLEARAPMAYRYAFQDEYEFLRSGVERLPEGCTVAQLAVRGGPLQRDLDCCLDAPRSPLIAARPDLRFTYVDPRAGAAPFGTAGCVAYYEGAACSLADTAATRARNEDAPRWFRDGCRRARAAGTLELLHEARVAPHATTDAFDGGPVLVRLYRVRGGAPAAR